MMRKYSVLIASTKDNLEVAARGIWTILKSTIREFPSLMTNDDQQMGDIGQIRVEDAGWVALAYRDE